MRSAMVGLIATSPAIAPRHRSVRTTCHTTSAAASSGYAQLDVIEDVLRNGASHFPQSRCRATDLRLGVGRGRLHPKEHFAILFRYRSLCLALDCSRGGPDGRSQRQDERTAAVSLMVERVRVVVSGPDGYTGRAMVAGL